MLHHVGAGQSQVVPNWLHSFVSACLCASVRSFNQWPLYATRRSSPLRGKKRTFEQSSVVKFATFASRVPVGKLSRSTHPQLDFFLHNQRISRPTGGTRCTCDKISRAWTRLAVPR